MSLRIVDFEKSGNLIKFYLGTEEQFENGYGDDWDDTPYEHNAGIIYDEYYTSTVDVAFDTTYLVLEPKEDWHNNGNSSYCKEDLQARSVPCIVYKKITDDYHKWEWIDCFNEVVKQEDIGKIYYGDDWGIVKEQFDKDHIHVFKVIENEQQNIVL